MKEIRLGVNVDHVATLREARGTQYPDVVEAARICERAGAHGITAHLREDRRHIQDRDVYALKDSIKINLNLEMANSAEIVSIALDLCPEEVCIVPEKREELTTEGGLDVVGNYDALAKTVEAMGEKGIAVSLFIDPSEAQVNASARLKVPYVEFHTGTFCNLWDEDNDADMPAPAMEELTRLIESAELAHSCGIKVNAGHGLNLKNVEPVLQMPHLDTLNIGHSLVADSVFVGMEHAVKAMLQMLKGNG
ncbi:pyridoxine 5'-phosphate synthase [bacterium B17]|nr:pyridoxine 5'-phosphate synthase [bacterium B17]